MNKEKKVVSERLNADEIEFLAKEIISKVGIGEISTMGIVNAYKNAVVQIRPEKPLDAIVGPSNMPPKLIAVLESKGLHCNILRRVKVKVEKVEEHMEEVEPAPEVIVEQPSVLDRPSLEWSVAKLMGVLVDKLVDEKVETLRLEYSTKIAELNEKVEELCKKSLIGAIEKVEEVYEEVHHPKHNPEPVQEEKKRLPRVLIAGYHPKSLNRLRTLMAPHVVANIYHCDEVVSVRDALKNGKYEKVFVWVGSKMSHKMKEVCAVHPNFHPISAASVYTLASAIIEAVASL